MDNIESVLADTTIDPHISYATYFDYSYITTILEYFEYGILPKQKWNFGECSLFIYIRMVDKDM